MADLVRYAAALERSGRSLPPVEQWDPPYCGALDLVLRRDGAWVHEGAVIKRAELVRLFSTVLRREGARYFLVTPAEKLEIVVEDAPFVAVLMRVESRPAGRTLVFTTNTGDEVAAGPEHRLEWREDADGAGAPYLHVRAGLWARIARAVYYDLVALAETRPVSGEPCLGVASAGVFFPLGRATDASDESGDAVSF